jgi:hypothetical protein
VGKRHGDVLRGLRGQMLADRLEQETP